MNKRWACDECKRRFDDVHELIEHEEEHVKPQGT